jgi:release factor glutamine methyltransferase
MEKKQHEVLKWASLFLESHNRETRVAEFLLQHHLGLSRNAFIMNMREPIPSEIEEVFRADIKKHAETGMPIQHMMGYEEFYGRKFKVNEHVLIPRPETEELIEHVIMQVNKQSNKKRKLVDVGTGSGVIAITLALELPEMEIIATDISKEALAVAKENAKNLGADITFLEGNYLEPLIHQQLVVDILVSNPPYIAKSEKMAMQDTVKNFDPALALFSPQEGLASYKEIIHYAPKVLNNQGLLAFEIGHQQGNAVKELIQHTFPQMAVDILKDMNGKDRIVIAK